MAAEAPYHQMTFSPGELHASRAVSDMAMEYWAPSEIVAANLDLDLHDLEGLILNVGAGIGLDFEHAVAQLSEGRAKVISYDLGYRTGPDNSQTAREYLFESLDERGNEATDLDGFRSQVGLVAVAGYAEALPFPSNRFNFTLSHAAVPTHSSGTRQLISSLAEMIRVTAIGGQIIGAPFHTHRVSEINQFMNCQQQDPQIKSWSLDEFEPAYSRDTNCAYRLVVNK